MVTGADPEDLRREADKLGPQRFGARFRARRRMPEALQLRTVESKCKANWPAQKCRPSVAGTLDRAAIHGLDDEGPREEAVVSPRGCGQNRGHLCEGPVSPVSGRRGQWSALGTVRATLHSHSPDGHVSLLGLPRPPILASNGANFGALGTATWLFCWWWWPRWGLCGVCVCVGLFRSED